MEHLQWYDYVRLLNAVLALASAYLLAKRRNRDGSMYTQRLNELSWCMQAFLILFLIGSLEQVFAGTPFGYRLVLTTFVLLACLRAALRKEPLVKEGYHG